jgi:hypothetical protein
MGEGGGVELVHRRSVRGIEGNTPWTELGPGRRSPLHTVVPIMAVADWLTYGPRPVTSPTVARLAVLFPVAYLAFTLIRGEPVGFYAYPFVDVGRLGYGRVLVNCVWVAVLYLGFAAGATALDAWLSRTRTTTQPSSS